MLYRWFLVICAVLVCLTTACSSDDDDSEWSYTPEEVTAAQMFAALRPATPEETDLLQEQAESSGDPYLIEAAKRIYVATGDVPLAAAEEPTTVVLPADLRWTAGQLGNIVLLRTAGVSLSDLDEVYTFTDPMCHAEYLGLAGQGVCMNSDAQEPGSWEDMLTHLRRPTDGELRVWLGDDYTSDSTHLYYVATSSFVAAPEHKFYGVPGETLGIFMPPGVQVLGGQLGYMDLHQVSSVGEAFTGWVGDTLCFMADSRLVWDDGAANIGQPRNFAPQAELERVEGCVRP